MAVFPGPNRPDDGINKLSTRYVWDGDDEKETAELDVRMVMSDADRAKYFTVEKHPKKQRDWKYTWIGPEPPVCIVETSGGAFTKKKRILDGEEQANRFLLAYCEALRKVAETEAQDTPTGSATRSKYGPSEQAAASSARTGRSERRNALASPVSSDQGSSSEEEEEKAALGTPVGWNKPEKPSRPTDPIHSSEWVQDLNKDNWREKILAIVPSMHASEPAVEGLERRRIGLVEMEYGGQDEDDVDEEYLPHATGRGGDEDLFRQPMDVEMLPVGRFTTDVRQVSSLVDRVAEMARSCAEMGHAYAPQLFQAYHGVESGATGSAGATLCWACATCGMGEPARERGGGGGFVGRGAAVTFASTETACFTDRHGISHNLPVVGLSAAFDALCAGETYHLYSGSAPDTLSRQTWLVLLRCILPELRGQVLDVCDAAVQCALQLDLEAAERGDELPPIGGFLRRGGGGRRRGPHWGVRRGGRRAGKHGRHGGLRRPRRGRRIVSYLLHARVVNCYRSRHTHPEELRAALQGR
jgi:hypothetical protein